MKMYHIKDVCRLSGCSIRTLQYYDQIQLLSPASRAENGYRLYTDREIIKLHQIITLKYLGHSLSDIKTLLSNDTAGILKSLQHQAETLAEQAKHISKASKLLTYIASQLQAGGSVNWESTSTLISILETSEIMDKTVELNTPEQSNLGKTSPYESQYNPGLLFAVARSSKRDELGIVANDLPFHGFDIWNHYEVSWLNSKGKPEVATAIIVYDCATPNIVESKSLKLYFNSLNNSTFESALQVAEIIEKDLEQLLEGKVNVILQPLQSQLAPIECLNTLAGINIDSLDVECKHYTPNTALLSCSPNDLVEETLVSDLLKSNCLVTNQPDWGSVQISYKGPKIAQDGLLKYIVSFRNHNEFHEQCIERIFIDILKSCQPSELTVYGRYTRRGGIDINPLRSTKALSSEDINQRLIRQ